MEKERKERIVKIAIISILVALAVTAIILASVLISVNKKIDETNKNNQEIIQQLENIENND